MTRLGVTPREVIVACAGEETAAAIMSGLAAEGWTFMRLLVAADGPTEERWLPVVGHEETHEVSSEGRIWSRPKGRMLRPKVVPGQYQQISLSRFGPVYLHGVVAAAFLGACPAGQEVRHLNGDETDNRLVNLAYGTRVENRHDDLRNGRNPLALKTHCVNGHEFTEATRLRLRRNTDRVSRVCLVCEQARNAAGAERRRRN